MNLNKGTIETYMKLLAWAYFNDMEFEEFKEILYQYDNSIEDVYYCEIVSFRE